MGKTADATGIGGLSWVMRYTYRGVSRIGLKGAIACRRRGRLELTDTPIDEIGWRAGYEDPAFFRRLFKRLTGVTSGAYRRKYRTPVLLSAAR